MVKRSISRTRVLDLGLGLGLAALALQAWSAPAAVPPTRAARPVVASGEVPDEATKAAVLQRLRDQYGADQVVNELQVAGVQMPPNWLQHVQKLLADPLLKQVRNGQLIVRGQQVELQGEVASEALRQDVAQSLSQQLNGAYSLKNALRVGSTEQGQLDQVLAGRIVEFEPGSAVLRPQGMALLDEIGGVLQTVQGKRVQIVGHTDGQGERASNITLSLARADAVRQYLVQKHRLPAQQLSIDGMGPDQPVASNATEEGRARNRRIEFRAGI
ncbi:OmpA family protein [Mitsuaria sp. WAJ17]|uniref:OmpA family protein n=1 Tax=Mitsuaria sp. WAJ17 TaxID=2761452 RepID=UPI00160418B4|nr:OmpA family protein [Mitsuaria sp. WAJ17]MBB2487172.1 OmpA family protein [Mitsuaria sp. WAJ17]